MFYVCMWTNVQGLYHIQSRYLPYRPHTLKFFFLGGSKFLSCFYFLLSNIQTRFS